jgi:nucleoid-associated protein YgaU
MKKENLFYLLGLASIFVLSGCLVRTYPLVRDRVDQDLSEGNRGVIQGKKVIPETERKATRATRVVEIEMGSPSKSGKASKALRKTEATESIGNLGYTSESELMEIGEAGTAKMGVGSFKEYTVQKGDTLQKISQKMYGTTKKWNKIYEANTGTLKGPNKIYPGMVLNIPQEGMMEIPEKIK